MDMRLKRADYLSVNTPCFLLSSRNFNATAQAFVRAWRVHPAPVKVAFSVKTCNSLQLLECVRRQGLCAEVVSGAEYELARHAGFEPGRIVYNGPAKTQDTFAEAIAGGAVVNIETMRELQWLAALPAPVAGETAGYGAGAGAGSADGQIPGKFNVGLRVAVNLSRIAPREAEGPDDYSRFGFDVDCGNFREAVDALAAMPHVRLAGLHLHRTIRSRRVDFYRRLVRFAADVIRDYNLDLDYLDLGGGYHEPSPGAPSFADYAHAAAGELAEAGLDWLAVILEPGNALAANALQYVCTVNDVKVTPSRNIVTVDGSCKDVDPLYRRQALRYKIVRADNTADNVACSAADNASPPYPLQTVCGATCMEYDKILTITDKPALRVGDRIVIEHAGAYTYSLAPQFINARPPVLVV